jgi:SSS family solute:Na+ symporter
MVDNLFVIGFLFLVLVIGFFKSKSIRNMREYSIADKNYSLPVMVATVTATVIGGGSTFGIISSVFSSGIIYILISFGNPLNSFLVGQFFVNKMDTFNDCISVGDIMDKFYGRNARIIAGICGAFYCAAAVGGQVSAIGFIINYFLDIPFFLGVLIGCGAVILYSSFGGVKAVTATDVIQFAVIILAIPMVCNIGLNLVGGYSALIEKVPAPLLALPESTGSLINYFFIFLAFSVPFLDPPTTQRLLMAKDRTQIRRTLRLSALIMLPFFLVVGLIGLIAVAINPGYDANMAFPHLVNTILPIGLKGVAIAGLLSVVMSTADSYLNAAGITLVHDVIKPLYRHELKDRTELRLAQIATFILGTGATIIALSFTSIMSIILFSLNFWGPIIVVPLYAGLLGIKASRQCFYGGICGGLGVFFLWHFFVEAQLGISSLIPSMAANLLGFAAVYYFQKIQRLRSQASYS